MKKKQVKKVSPNPFFNWNKIWEQFSQCLIYAKSGKTFVYLSNDFVCMDAQTYQKLSKKPSMDIMFYDEFATMSPEKMAEFMEVWKKASNDVQQVRSERKAGANN